MQFNFPLPTNIRYTLVVLLHLLFGSGFEFAINKPFLNKKKKEMLLPVSVVSLFWLNFKKYSSVTDMSPIICVGIIVRVK